MVKINEVGMVSDLTRMLSHLAMRRKGLGSGKCHMYVDCYLDEDATYQIDDVVVPARKETMAKVLDLVMSDIDSEAERLVAHLKKLGVTIEEGEEHGD